MTAKKNINSFCGFSRSEEEIKYEKEKQRKRFKMVYPGKEAYVFPGGKCNSYPWLYFPFKGFNHGIRDIGLLKRIKEDREHDRIIYEEEEEEINDGD